MPVVLLRWYPLLINLSWESFHGKIDSHDLWPALPGMADKDGLCPLMHNSLFIQCRARQGGGASGLGGSFPGNSAARGQGRWRWRLLSHASGPLAAQFYLVMQPVFLYDRHLRVRDLPLSSHVDFSLSRRAVSVIVT
jgi:hypothetical protein